MKKLRVHYFQHIAQEGFGSCYSYLKEMGAEITATEFFALPPDVGLEIDALPSVDQVDLLIIMGGKMSVNDESNYAWLKVEKRWIRRYLATEKAVIGLCLGGQLIANALGAIVEKNRKIELGWSKVYAAQPLCEPCFKLPVEFEVMQWHEETFALPKGAIKLAENSACTNQAYQIGQHVLAFQFHPEITKDTIKLFVEQSFDEPIMMGVTPHFLNTLSESDSERFIQGNQILRSAIDYVLATR